MHGPTSNHAAELLLFLAVAGIVIPAFLRFKVNPVFGFLIVGVALGPGGLGRFVPSVPWLTWITVDNREDYGLLAEFGVVFLLFMIGLELSLERLMTMRRLVFGLGGAQVIVSSVALASLLWLTGSKPAEAMVLGASLSLSSTAIVIQLLASQRRIASTTGRVSFAVLIFQDLMVVPILFLVGVLGAREGASAITGLALALVQATLVILAIVLVGKKLLQPILKQVALAQSPDLFMAACLLVVISAAMAAAASGLSMALGAFVAGLILAETEYRRAVEVTIEPFRGLLLGVFFFSVGASIDLGAIFAEPLVYIGAAAALVVVKACVILGVGRLFRVARRPLLETALLLGPGGEFAFVVAGVALAAGIVETRMGQIAVTAASLSMAAIPLLDKLAHWGTATLAPQGQAVPDEPPPQEDKPRVLVVGYGRVGRLVGDMLKEHAIPYLSVDGDAKIVSEARKAGRPVYFGDASHIEYLKLCDIERAPAVVVTMDNPKAVDAVVGAIRAERPDVVIVARARDERHARHLYEIGVTEAVPETIEASLQLSEATLIGLGIPIGRVLAAIHQHRDDFRAQFQRIETAERLGAARSRYLERLRGGKKT